MKKLYRLQEDKKIAGVCAGLGAHFDMDPVLFRIIFIVLFMASGIGILIYLVMWVLVPLQKEVLVKTVNGRKKLYLSVSNKKIAGVCGGLGEFFAVDSVFFRVGFVVLFLAAGIGLALYIMMWMIIPKTS
ncbi:MAG: PspC domain-containing protein [Candidatus Omnitrophica bacterium]|nr:PspC domain-containing protein [Candidatus Omnitrophota bacterium]MCB9747458.1 PspC domain-containing protein [Candidatus Omnitrophota bacterium]